MAVCFGFHGGCNPKPWPAGLSTSIALLVVVVVVVMVVVMVMVRGWDEDGSARGRMRAVVLVDIGARETAAHDFRVSNYLPPYQHSWISVVNREVLSTADTGNMPQPTNWKPRFLCDLYQRDGVTRMFLIWWRLTQCWWGAIIMCVDVNGVYLCAQAKQSRTASDVCSLSLSYFSSPINTFDFHAYQ